jgi:hypothetical protein
MLLKNTELISEHREKISILKKGWITAFQIVISKLIAAEKEETIKENIERLDPFQSIIDSLKAYRLLTAYIFFKSSWLRPVTF